MAKVITNLCIIRDGAKILLGKKTRKIGKGFYNAPGGKLEEGEDILGSTVREVREEVGLKVKNLQKVGELTFEFEDKSPTILMHIFLTKDFEGEVTDSEQMEEVQWFDVNQIPFEQMFPDDKFWLPAVLEGKKIEAKFIFDHPPTFENPGKIISHSITELPREPKENINPSWKLK